MKAVVRRDLSIRPRMDALMKKLGVTEDFEEEFAQVYEVCARVANPKYLYCKCEARQDAQHTYIGEEAFDSRIMRVELEGIDAVYPYAATCGTELYELALSTEDPLGRYWIDGFSEHALYLASARALSEIEELAGTDKISSMNPGSLDDFPLAEQKPLFRLLGDAESAIGLRLTDSCLMLPYKSSSGIYYATESDFVSCALCQRANCPNRRAEFDEMRYNTRYALA
ncbi:MAG: vitamin B12 dependent methionine synthase [Christensenellales bacterium]|jgi:hypothetical protein